MLKKNCLECDCILTLVSFSVGNVYFWKVVKLPGLLNEGKSKLYHFLYKMILDKNGNGQKKNEISEELL